MVVVVVVVVVVEEVVGPFGGGMGRGERVRTALRRDGRAKKLVPSPGRSERNQRRKPRPKLPLPIARIDAATGGSEKDRQQKR